jgi:myo-inositol-1-phosphate synthase
VAKIRVAIVGVGNCASSLIQGLEYYRGANDTEVNGLMHPVVGDWSVRDIEVVCAFDIDRRKVGKPLEQAIFAKPNCTTVFQAALPVSNVIVQMGPILDGIAGHMAEYSDDAAFRPSDAEPVDVAQALKESGAEVLICYLPVGSEQAVRHYAQACLDANVAMVNCVPVFIASDPVWAAKFREAGVPIVGDDIKSQVGATIVHRTLSRLFNDRGVSLDRTYQLNTGGNTDFLNMLEMSRLKSKKESKTESVQSQLETRLSDRNIHIGPSDYVPWQNDNKVAFIRMEGRGFGDVPMHLELRLSVEDSPNSAGVVIDALRCAKLGLERGEGGPLEAPSSYFMKHPPVQLRDSVARDVCNAFIGGGPARITPEAVSTDTMPKGAGAVRPRSALILAAGLGSRLVPNTSLPKPLAQVHGLTLAEWVVRTLRDSIDIERFVVSIGYEADTVRSHFRSVAKRSGVAVEFVSASDWTKGNGASALAAAKSFGEEPFVLTMCDHLYDHALPLRLVREAPEPGHMLLAADYDKANLLDIDDVTKVKTNVSDIAAINKALTDWDCSDTGVMYCTSGLFDGLREAAKDGEHGLSAGLARLAAKSRAHVVDVTGCWWLDVDTAEARLLAERYLADRLRSIG